MLPVNRCILFTLDDCNGEIYRMCRLNSGHPLTQCTYPVNMYGPGLERIKIPQETKKPGVATICSEHPSPPAKKRFCQAVQHFGTQPSCGSYQGCEQHNF